MGLALRFRGGSLHPYPQSKSIRGYTLG